MHCDPKTFPASWSFHPFIAITKISVQWVSIDQYAGGPGDQVKLLVNVLCSLDAYRTTIKCTEYQHLHILISLYIIRQKVWLTGLAKGDRN